MSHRERPKESVGESMGSVAIAPDHRAALWKAMLTADFNVCYWTLLSHRDTRIDVMLRGLLALSSSGVTAWTVWAHYPLLLTYLSMASSVVAWLHTVVFTSDRLKKVAGLVGAWKQIAVEYELLWEYDCDLGNVETWKRFEEACKLQGKIDETGLSVNHKLLERAYQQMMKKRGLQNNGR
jgi:hypothetical protein